MTTRTTTIRTSSNGVRALIGAAAASLAVLGGALLWQLRPTSETTAPPTAAVSTYDEGVAPMGGLAELYGEQQAAQRAGVARLERMGGMGELYRDQASAPTAPPVGVPALTDGSGRYATAAQAPAARVTTNGMAGLDAAPVVAAAASEPTAPALTDGAGHYFTAPLLPAATARGGASGDCASTVGAADC